MVVVRPIVVAIAVAAALSLSGCGPVTSPPAPAGSKDVGIQLFQWTWDAIAAECSETLGPEGIAWVLTSPPNEHITGREWWTSYQPVSYLIESRLGTRDEFAAMVETCDTAGVDIIVDAVINHMSGQDSAGVGWAGSPYEHYAYPGLYAPDDFHHCGLTTNDDIANYKNQQQVQTCELVNLADLATETDGVRATIGAYLDDVLSLGVAGFRIDAAKHMAAADVAAIVATLPADTRILQEVIRGGGEPIQPEDYTATGQVFEFAFARDVKTMVESGQLFQGTLFGADYGSLPSEDAIVFVENHDTERNGETLDSTDGRAYLLGVAFMLAQPYGTPVLYSGYAFEGRDAGPAQDSTGAVIDANCGDIADRASGQSADVGEFTCQQRWSEVRGMLAFRSAVGSAAVSDEWNDSWVYAFGRGAAGYIVINTGEDSLTRRFETSLAPGDYTDVFSGDSIAIGSDGSFEATVDGMTALAIHVGSVQ